MIAIGYDAPIHILKLLIDAGADLNLKDEDGNNVLTYVNVYSDRFIETVKFLIKAGADLYDANYKGESVLMKYANQAKNFDYNLENIFKYTND
jgi:ankyrin repeat protein